MWCLTHTKAQDPQLLQFNQLSRKLHMLHTRVTPFLFLMLLETVKWNWTLLRFYQERNNTLSRKNCRWKFKVFCLQFKKFLKTCKVQGSLSSKRKCKEEHITYEMYIEMKGLEMWGTTSKEIKIRNRGTKLLYDWKWRAQSGFQTRTGWGALT